MQEILRYTTWCPLNSPIRNCYLSFFLDIFKTYIYTYYLQFFPIVEWERNLLILFRDFHCSLGIEMSKLKSLLKKNGREHISPCHSGIFCYFFHVRGFQFQQAVENHMIWMDTVFFVFSYVLLVRAVNMVWHFKGSMHFLYL